MQLDFLLIGAPKSGTTWAWKYLDQHQRFFVPGAKDTYYFDRHYVRGAQWYENHFGGASAEQLVGEVCHDYMYSADAIERISRDVPESCQVVLILREPVSRALSQARYGHQMAHLSELTARSVMAEDPDCLTRSRYEQFLPLISSTFGSRLTILLYEDLVTDPLEFAKQLAAACSGGEVGHGTTSLPGETNASATPKSRALMRLIRFGVAQMDRFGQRRLIGAIKSSPLRALLFTDAKQDIDLDDLRQFFEEHLQQSVEQSTALVAQYRPSVVQAWQRSER